MSTGRRGAVRSQAARSAILAAASWQLERVGYDRVTMEGIASQASVGKQTIYRWWPSKSAIVAECLIEGALLPETYAPRDSGDVGADLGEWLARVFAFIAVPDHTMMLRSLIAAAVENPEVGERLAQRLGAAPDVLNDRIETARAAGQLRPGVSVAALVDAFIGVILARVLMPAPGHDDAPAVVDLILHGATVPPKPSRR